MAIRTAGGRACVSISTVDKMRRHVTLSPINLHLMQNQYLLHQFAWKLRAHSGGALARAMMCHYAICTHWVNMPRVHRVDGGERRGRGGGNGWSQIINKHTRCVGVVNMQTTMASKTARERLRAQVDGDDKLVLAARAHFAHAAKISINLYIYLTHRRTHFYTRTHIITMRAKSNCIWESAIAQDVCNIRSESNHMNLPDCGCFLIIIQHSTWNSFPQVILSLSVAPNIDSFIHSTNNCALTTKCAPHESTRA